MNKRILFSALLALGFGLGLTACNKGGQGGEAAKGTATSGQTAGNTAAATADSDLIPVGDSYTKGGGSDALVTIVEFSDF
ncbi:MAG: hypothetical protein KC613_26015, partial [Myxococcales bacterium]|nr:hypothetical protein [Myxococcales bacterium]